MPIPAKWSLLSIINVLAELCQQQGDGNDLQKQNLDLGSANAPHHTIKQPAGPFKPSLTVLELQSNINLQHPGLSASDKRRRSWGDDREGLVAGAHRDGLATPCLQMLYNDLYNITAARQGVFTGLQIPTKIYDYIFFPPPCRA